MSDMNLSPARPATSVAEMSPDGIRDWADSQWQTAPRPKACTVRLEIVRVLREVCYTQVNQPTERQQQRIPTDTYALAKAEAILDTPVDQLAEMVVVSDTVLGNWRTIAATLTQW